MRIVILIRILCILCFCFCIQGSSFLYAEAVDTPLIYAIPSSETEKIISDWLSRSGYAVIRSLSAAKENVLQAERGDEIWRIRISPYSPLASQIIAEYTINSIPDETKVMTLYSFMQKYIKGLRKEPKADMQDIPSAVISHKFSTVCIRALTGDEPVQFSGFFLNKNMIIATAHDLGKVQEITVILPDGRELEGHLVRIDYKRDLTLIEVNADVFTTISLNKIRDQLKDKQQVYAVGCPSNHYGIVNSGTIDGPQRWVNKLPIWLVDMEVVPGSSGSPVFDAQGNLIGIIKGRDKGIRSKGFFIPVKTLLNFLTKD